MQKCGIVFMPKNVSQLKIENTLKLGFKNNKQYVKIKLIGNNFDEALKEALNFVNKNNATFIHPYDDENTINGQSTMMSEICNQLETCDYIFCPVGGGGLLAGIIKIINEKKLKTKVIACQTEVCPSLTPSLQEMKNVETQIKDLEIITDGSIVKKIGNLPWQMISHFSHLQTEVLNNNQVLYAMGLLQQKHSIPSEGAAALATAGFLNYAKKHNLENKNVVIVNSGGNVSNELVDRGLNIYLNSNFSSLF
jgi:threonine dehydratase